MAPETTKTKRKSLDRKVKTTEDAPPAKKAKTSTDAPNPDKVKAAAEAKKNRKRAADFIDTAEAEVEKSETVPKKTKKQKTAAPAEEASEETATAPKAKKAKAEKRSKKLEEAAELAEEKPVKVKKGKKAEKSDEVIAEVVEPVEEKPIKAKKAKVDKGKKKAEEVAEAVEAVEEKPAKAKKAKVDKSSKKTGEPVEVTEVPEVAEDTITVTAKPKKSKVDKRGKKAAEPTEVVEETTIVESIKPKKAKTAKKDATLVEVTEETTTVETTKPKKGKAEKTTKKVVEVIQKAEVAPVSILKKGKADKKAVKPDEEADVLPTSISKPKTSKANKSSTTNGESKKLVAAESLEDAFDGFSSGEEDNIADQTAALLAGFESTDESEAEDEGIPLNQVPSVKLTKESKKALAAANKDGDDVPGTIYVGRVPHGFYEHQMKAYFTQFGEIARLRLSRNKKTGASKHFAFIEFASSEVAEIVARTMNNYLMFGHILKVRLIPEEQVHKDLWKGAGKRFKVIPRAKLAARDLAQPKGREYWRKKVENEEGKRKEQAEKLKELGYEFEMPSVRKVEDVPMKGTDDAAAVQPPEGAEAMVVDEPVVKAIEPASAIVQDPVEKEVMSVIAKKKGKGKGTEIIGDAVKVTKKAKKEKKKAKA